MTPYVEMLLAHIRPESQGAFLYEYRRYAKDPSLALVLTLVLGIVGGESYYLGNVKRGILFTLALLSGIGLFVTVPMWIVRCFTVQNDVESENDYLAYALAFRYADNATAFAPQPPAEAPRKARGPIGGVPMRVTG